jgi:hypothetical protein
LVEGCARRRGSRCAPPAEDLGRGARRISGTQCALARSFSPAPSGPSPRSRSFPPGRRWTGPLGELEEETGALVAVSSDRTLTLVDLDARTSRSRRLPELAPGDPPLRLARRGDLLVFHGTAPGGGRAGHVPLAADGDLLAWCERDCRAVSVTDVAVGLEQRVELPEGTRAREHAGALSRGGRFLAHSLLLAGDVDGAGDVLVVELATGEQRLVAGGVGRVPDKLSWTAGGERLFFHVPGCDLLAYRPWEPDARRVLVDLGGPVYGFAVLERPRP